jgi:hypothetical protein
MKSGGSRNRKCVAMSIDNKRTGTTINGATEGDLGIGTGREGTSRLISKRERLVEPPECALYEHGLA